MTKYYPINESRAASARAMWSMRDYKEGSTTREYQQSVDECYAAGEQAKQRTKEDRHGYIDYLCDKYAKRLAEYYNKDISIQLMCPSVMISGGSNFPVRKKERQNAAQDKNMQFYNQIQEIIGKLSYIGTGREIIKSNDPQAAEMLQDKIDKLTALQTDMKAANAHYRKHGTMKDYDCLTDEEAAELDKKIKADYSWCQCPYPAYRLTNNNATIRETTRRLERLLTVKDKGTTETETEFFKVVENAEAMRLQLIFDGKPSETVRGILKSNGFKWSPSQSAWQRQLTANAKYALRTVMREIKSERVNNG